ncbi:hypothetical protein BSR28_05460 [Boudabousia liubingyangii]|uniref:variant leucine-rich repeat-containing protein n=1 Tax=Boudabousia liubingyangii TaxID=1921764 RepID=UPI00093C4FAF|nr:hypothetical protein [Boudabousia liubingyangii]OKL46874.1 hypothetical protein BSR28_05460 [Boudabousia liubingyangii]
MSPNAEFDRLASLAADPNVDLTQLRDIAAAYPGLRPTIALNPATYPDLLQWLSSLNDPQVNQALMQRQQMINAGTFGMQGVTQAQNAAQAAEPVYSNPADRPDPQDSSAPQPQYSDQGMAAGAAGAQGASSGAEARDGFTTQTAPEGFAVAEAQEEKKSHGKAVVLILAFLLAATIVGIVVSLFTGVLTLGGGANDSNSKGTVATAEKTVSEDESKDKQEPTQEAPEPTKEAPTVEAPIKFPAPSGSVIAPAFSSPSGNISCIMTEDVTYCSIRERDYLKEGAGACNGVFGLRINKEGDALQTCNDELAKKVQPNAPTLVYGTSAANQHYACTSDPAGISCWNLRTGKAFTMRRADFATGIR